MIRIGHNAHHRGSNDRVANKLQGTVEHRETLDRAQMSKMRTGLQTTDTVCCAVCRELRPCDTDTCE